MKGNIILIKEFFGDVRPVSMEELKSLSRADREELGAAIAKQRGLVAVTAADGSVQYKDAA